MFPVVLREKDRGIGIRAGNFGVIRPAFPSFSL